MPDGKDSGPGQHPLSTPEQILLAGSNGLRPRSPALADPTRRHIFERAPERSASWSRRFPVSRLAVSQHLRVLADAGLVTARSDGARRVYSADPRGFSELRSQRRVSRMSQKTRSRTSGTYWNDGMNLIFLCPAAKPSLFSINSGCGSACS